MDITELLAFSAKQGASDLHLSAGLPPMIRVDGDVRRINLPPMDHKQVHELIDQHDPLFNPRVLEVFWHTCLFARDIARDNAFLNQFLEALVHRLHAQSLAGLDSRVHLRHLVLADKITNSRGAAHDFVCRNTAAGGSLQQSL